MVAVIKTGHSIHRILNYNENKVKEGVAEIISAQNYPIDVDQLSFTHKLNRLLHQAALNENVSRNSVHISLNFDPSEKLTKERLQEIADTYMERIGFGEQPYLVYQHFDAGHPHLHIVSIKVRPNGSRIDTQNIGRNQSEKARKEIELSYGLVKAQGPQQNVYELKSAFTPKVQYGKYESRKAIAHVLEAVLSTYKYTSLPELNAVLQQYNVCADPGNEGSRIHQHEGLLYRILDEKGQPVGVPIKASSLYNKPTLKFLKEKFSTNDAARQTHKARVKNTIDLALLKQPDQSLPALIKTLEKEGINTVLRQNKDGLIYGLTYVDHRTKCVFNGSTLGKQYSAKGILERCGQSQEPRQKTASVPEQFDQQLQTQNKAGIDLIETLLQQEYTGSIPGELTGKARKKKKKHLSKRL